MASAAACPHRRRLAVLVAHQSQSHREATQQPLAAAGAAAPFKIVFMEPGGVAGGGRVELTASHVK